MGAILAMAFGGSGARGVGGGEAPPDWWSPPKDVRAMLGQVEASTTRERRLDITASPL